MRLSNLLWFALLGLALLGLGGLLVSFDPAADDVRPPVYNRAFNAARFLEDLNSYRRSHGLNSLRFDSALNSAARVHAEWCRRTGTLGHEGPGGNTFIDRVRTAGYGGRAVTENFAFLSSEPTATGLLRAWQNSPGHDAGLKMPATECGVWVTESDPAYCVWVSGFRSTGSAIGAIPPERQAQGIQP